MVQQVNATKPFFSIIIPTYNRSLLLKKAINSVVSQTFSDWELVIIDDGSTDNTKETVQSFKDTRIKYRFQENAERSAARNNGIKNAQGEYICFLDSDDYYLPNRLSLLYTSIEKRKFPIASFYTGLILKKKEKLEIREEKIKSENVFDQIALSAIHSQQVCIHQKIFAKYNYDTNFHIGEDMELWLRIAAEFTPEYIPNQHTVVVVDHMNRSVNVKLYNSYVHQMRMFNRIFSTNHPGSKISKAIKKKLISNAYFGMAKYFIYSGNRLKAVINLLSAIVADFGNESNKYRLNLVIHLLFSSNKVIQLLET